ncbi:probable glutathione S-transferase [Asparagus officinalis]|uniref:probable glutathione S-transferase n=1 Tax=Asparagus officinalis TaxID=4686 RepID=UPI00098E5851|nr:probable glutathione S-transferase [Asparagus officinalis]
MAKEVKLLRFWTSPFCGRVELALELKGVPYDIFDEDLPNKSTLLLESSPVYKEVPVLLHKGNPIIGSMTIIEYIDDAWGGHPILPKDPYERAQARFFAKFIDEKCIPTFRNSFWSEGDLQKSCLEKSKEYLSILEKELKGKKFFGGNSIGYLDIAAAYIAHWAGVFQEVAEVDLFDKKNHPILWKWSQDFVNYDVCKKCLPQREKLLAFFQPRKEAMKAYVKPSAV